DALLPAVEEGTLTLIGATTENPYFSVNGALLSRSQVLELRALTAEHVETLLRRAIEGGELGDVTFDDEAIAFLATRSGGDARSARCTSRSRRSPTPPTRRWAPRAPTCASTAPWPRPATCAPARWPTRATTTPTTAPTTCPPSR